jgi:drug/metabolite transporter superfamily protein YnfA
MTGRSIALFIAAAVAEIGGAYLLCHGSGRQPAVRSMSRSISQPRTARLAVDPSSGRG